MTQKVSDEMLMAYVDGELDAANATAIERILADDTTLAARAETFRASRRLAREAFGSARDEQVPEFLLKSLLGQSGPATVVPFARPRRWLAALPLAASIAVAFGVGFYVAGGSGGGDAVDPLGRMAIARALGGTISGESSEVALGNERALLETLGTYRVEGGVCRSFDLDGAATSLAGVGCDRGGGWTLDVIVARGSGGDGGYVPASEAALGSIDAYLDALEASAPLTPDEERALSD
ncbi:hypothetical protein [Mesorhizobium sp. CAU 1741]|uniref:anti-sigma factor family protein n=1 Tax=Mesorhizobium sp. CAU 1741 TaxID=3140366 RepID=UPI00325B4746